MDKQLNTHLNNQCFCLITDGPLHLRQVLHPEALKKSILLPGYFYKYYDLKKQFRQCYNNNDVRTIDEMLNCKLT